MCELLGLSSNLPATITLSLMKLAEHGGFTGPHRDGWGVGYYEGADVRLLKEAESGRPQRLGSLHSGSQPEKPPRHRSREESDDGRACLPEYATLRP